MLERLLTRQRLCGAQILASLVAAAFSFDLAYAQSPGVMGVYRTANSTFGTGGYSAQGINAYGSGSNANVGMNGASGVAMSDPSMTGMKAAQNVLQSQEEWEAIQVDSPEYIYRGHEEKKPITSLEIVPWSVGTTASNSYASDAILSASCDMTARLWQLEGKYDPETTEFFVTNGRQRKIYREEHRQGLTSAVFAPGYKYVLTSSYDATGRLWTLNNQKNIRAYTGCKDRLWSIAVSDSGEFTAAACNDGRIYFWEPLTVQKLGSLPNREDAAKLGEGFEDVGHEGPVFDVAFSPDSRFVATAGADGYVRMWNLSLQRQVNAIKVADNDEHHKVYSVRFSEDGLYLLTASEDKTARMFNAVSGEEVCRFVGHTGAVRKAIFAGNYVATCSDDGTARLWTSSVASSANSRNAANGMNGMSMSADPMMGSVSMTGMEPTAGSNGRGEQQATGGKPTRAPGKPKGTELARFNANNPVFSVAVSSDQVYLVTGGADGLARVWRVPGNARYYSSSNNGNNVNGSGSGMNGFGNDPLANPDSTLPMGNMSGSLSGDK